MLSTIAFQGPAPILSRSSPDSGIDFKGPALIPASIVMLLSSPALRSIMLSTVAFHGPAQLFCPDSGIDFNAPVKFRRLSTVAFQGPAQLFRPDSRHPSHGAKPTHKATEVLAIFSGSSPALLF